MTLPARHAGLGLALTAVFAAQSTLQSDLDRIFADPVLARGVLAARIESLDDGRVLYAHDDQKLVMPASNMKALTLAAAAERLGWTFTFDTRLEAAGAIADGTLHGDLIVTGNGDPSIGSPDGRSAALFGEWARQLVAAGIQRVDGRIIGDDNALDDDGVGPGWSWDDLVSGYAAPSGALSYNENAATVRLVPGRAPGDPATAVVTPPGHGLRLINQVTTGAPGSNAGLTLTRTASQPVLTVRGALPAGGAPVTRSVSIDNPTTFFVEAFRLALAEHGIRTTGGGWDIDDLAEPAPAAASRRLIARHESAPLSALAGYFMKVSQNFYAETFLKTLGRVAGGAGTTAAGRRVVREMLSAWGVPDDAIVVIDGSGLSRYNYVTAGTMVTVLKRMWLDERMRGPFAASLPVAGHDGTLENRMRGVAALDARVQAKTGTISNVRALSGYLETRAGHRLVFSIVANHFTVPSARIDEIVERALGRLAEE